MDEEPKLDENGTNGTREEGTGSHEDPEDIGPGDGEEKQRNDFDTVELGKEDGEGKDIGAGDSEDREGNDFETVDLDKEAEVDEKDEDDEIPDMSSLLPPTDVPTLSHLFISMLTNSTWQHLGLIPDPRTRKIEMDLKQAGLAIDIIEFLYEKIKDDMEKEISSGVEDLLANLRINYVTRSTKTPDEKKT